MEAIAYIRVTIHDEDYRHSLMTRNISTSNLNVFIDKILLLGPETWFKFRDDVFTTHLPISYRNGWLQVCWIATWKPHHDFWLDYCICNKHTKSQRLTQTSPRKFPSSPVQFPSIMFWHYYLKPSCRWCAGFRRFMDAPQSTQPSAHHLPSTFLSHKRERGVSRWVIPQPHKSQHRLASPS